MNVNWQSLGGSTFLPPEFLNPGEQVLAVGANLVGFAQNDTATVRSHR